MKQHRPLEKGKQYPQEITCTWELTEPPTTLTYTYTSYLFSLLGPKLFVEECRQTKSKERLENCSVKTGKLAWVRPGGWKRQSCAQGTVTSPANWVRITRRKQRITAKVLDKCSQNMELRRSHISL